MTEFAVCDYATLTRLIRTLPVDYKHYPMISRFSTVMGSTVRKDPEILTNAGVSMGPSGTSSGIKLRREPLHTEKIACIPSMEPDQHKGYFMEGVSAEEFSNYINDKHIFRLSFGDYDKWFAYVGVSEESASKYDWISLDGKIIKIYRTNGYFAMELNEAIFPYLAEDTIGTTGMFVIDPEGVDSTIQIENYLELSRLVAAQFEIQEPEQTPACLHDVYLYYTGDSTHFNIETNDENGTATITEKYSTMNPRNYMNSNTIMRFLNNNEHEELLMYAGYKLTEDGSEAHYYVNYSGIKYTFTFEKDITNRAVLSGGISSTLTMIQCLTFCTNPSQEMLDANTLKVIPRSEYDKLLAIALNTHNQNDLTGNLTSIIQANITPHRINLAKQQIDFGGKISFRPTGEEEDYRLGVMQHCSDIASFENCMSDRYIFRLKFNDFDKWFIYVKTVGNTNPTYHWMDEDGRTLKIDFWKYAPAFEYDEPIFPYNEDPIDPVSGMYRIESEESEIVFPIEKYVKLTHMMLNKTSEDADSENAAPASTVKLIKKDISYTEFQLDPYISEKHRGHALTSKTPDYNENEVRACLNITHYLRIELPGFLDKWFSYCGTTKEYGENTWVAEDGTVLTYFIDQGFHLIYIPSCTFPDETFMMGAGTGLYCVDSENGTVEISLDIITRLQQRVMEQIQKQSTETILPDVYTTVINRSDPEESNVQVVNNDGTIILRKLPQYKNPLEYLNDRYILRATISYVSSGDVCYVDHAVYAGYTLTATGEKIHVFKRNDNAQFECTVAKGVTTECSIACPAYNSIVTISGVQFLELTETASKSGLINGFIRAIPRSEYDRMVACATDFYKSSAVKVYTSTDSSGNSTEVQYEVVHDFDFSTGTGMQPIKPDNWWLNIIPDTACGKVDRKGWIFKFESGTGVITYGIIYTDNTYTDVSDTENYIYSDGSVREVKFVNYNNTIAFDKSKIPLVPDQTGERQLVRLTLYKPAEQIKIPTVENESDVQSIYRSQLEAAIGIIQESSELDMKFENIENKISSIEGLVKNPANTKVVKASEVNLGGVELARTSDGYMVSGTDYLHEVKFVTSFSGEDSANNATYINDKYVFRLKYEGLSDRWLCYTKKVNYSYQYVYIDADGNEYLMQFYLNTIRIKCENITFPASVVVDSETGFYKIDDSGTVIENAENYSKVAVVAEKIRSEDMKERFLSAEADVKRMSGSSFNDVYLYYNNDTSHFNISPGANYNQITVSKKYDTMIPRDCMGNKGNMLRVGTTKYQSDIYIYAGFKTNMDGSETHSFVNNAGHTITWNFAKGVRDTCTVTGNSNTSSVTCLQFLTMWTSISQSMIDNGQLIVINRLHYDIMVARANDILINNAGNMEYITSLEERIKALEDAIAGISAMMEAMNE